MREPHPRTLQHTLGITEAYVCCVEALRGRSDLWMEFFFTNELQDVCGQLSLGGVIPDATLLLHNQATGRRSLFWWEVDLGNEPLRVLAAKMAGYAGVFDSLAYKAVGDDVVGFRVLFVVSPGRVKNVVELAGRDGHDFVLATSAADLGKGFTGRIWRNASGAIVDVFGRGGE